MKTKRSWWRFSLAGCALMAAAAGALLVTDSEASAKDPLGRSWPPEQMVSMDQIDHSAFDALLKKYVDLDGFVNYQAWKANPADRQALQQYLVDLSRANPRAPASREAQLSFWINAYNAVTLEGILQVYPTDSIRNHTARIAGYNLWKDLPLLVGGQPYSLDAIEHQVLRKMGEPRIHFAIVCASVGCPRLLNEAYVPSRLNEQLTTNARDFFSRPQNFAIDVQGTMHVSAILDWFGSDFGANQQERFRYLAPYLPENARQHAVQPGTRVTFQDYNWSLNDQARKPSGAGTRAASGRR